MPRENDSMPDPSYDRPVPLPSGHDDPPPTPDPDLSARGTIGPGVTPTIPPPDDVPARVGRFEVRAVLGQGAFGRVFRAFDPDLCREVAIKVPLPGAVDNPDRRERFLREARAAATLHHPNICPVHEIGTQPDGTPFIVMAFIAGKTLAAVLEARTAPVDPRQAAGTVRKLALALAAAHAKGVVHRDLKPANILIDRETREPVMTDFGLARVQTGAGDAGATREGAVMGTPAYMSPEQVMGEQAAVGPASDVYALGVILFEMLAGDRPFRGPVSAVFGQVLYADPGPPSARRPGIDPRLDAVCTRAMAKAPAARFASAKEMAARLDEYLRAAASASVTASQSAAASAMPVVVYAPPAEPDPREAFASMVADSATAPALPPTAPVAAGPGRKPWLLIGAGAALVVALLAGVVVTLNTPRGKLVVESDDPDAEIVVKGEGVTIRTKDREVVLKVGEYTIELAEPATKLRLDTDRFTIGGRGNEVRVRLEKPKKGGTSTTQTHPAGESADLKVAAWVLKAGGYVLAAGPDDREAEVHPGGAIPAGGRVVAVCLGSATRVTGADVRANLVGLKHLREVRITECPGFDDDGATALSAHPGLQMVVLDHTGVGDAGVRALRKCVKLRGLFLWGTKVTAAGLDGPDGAWPDLAELGLTGLPVTDDWLPKVARFPKLGWLRLDQPRAPGRVTPAGLAALAPLTQLRLLDLSGTTVDDAALRPLADLPALESLTLIGTAVRGEGLAHLKGLTALKTLALNESQAGDAAATHLAEFPALENVYFNRCPLGDDGAAALARSKTLCEAQLIGTRVGDRGLAALAAAPRLYTLGVDHCPQVTDAGVAALAGNTKLVRLGLVRTQVTDKGAAVLAGIRTLRELGLDATAVGDDGAAALAKLPALELLGLADTRVTDDGAKALAGAKTLRELKLGGTKVSQNGLRALRLALPICTITPAPPDDDRAAAEWVIGLGGSVVVRGGDGKEIVCPAVADLPAGPFQLVDINLWGKNGTTDEEMAKLPPLPHLRGFGNNGGRFGSKGLESLCASPNIRALDLCGVPIGDDALKSLTKLARLQSVSLDRTRVTDAGIPALKGLPELTSLGLSATAASDAAVEHLLGMPQLTTLNLHAAGLTEAGVTRLAGHKGLTHLNLNELPLTDRVVPALAGMKQLRQVQLTGTQVTPAGLRELRLALPNCAITPAPPDDDRKAAAWALSIKAYRVEVSNPDGSGYKGIRAIDEMPPGARLRFLESRENPAVTDAAVRENLVGLSSLYHLDFGDCKALTDAGVVAVKGLPALAELNLWNCPGVTDASVPTLVGMKPLRQLSLNGSGVTARGVAALGAAGQLEELGIGNLSLDDDSLKAVSGLSRLATLSIEHPRPPGRMTSAGAAHLKRLIKLRALHASGVGWDDSAVEHLAAITGLESLNLGFGPVTDASVPVLSKLTSMKELNLTGTRITPSGLAKLRAALPNCKISPEPPQDKAGAAGPLDGLDPKGWVAGGAALRAVAGGRVTDAGGGWLRAALVNELNLVPGVQGRDVAVRVRVRLPPGATLGLHLRATPDGNRTAYVARDVVGVGAFSRKVWTVLAERREGVAIPEEFEVTFAARGGRMAVSVGGGTVEAADDPPAAGGVAYDGKGAPAALVRDFEYQVLKPPAAPPDGK